MTMTMFRRTLHIAALLACVAGAASAAEFKGVLIDQACSAKAELRLGGTPQTLQGGMIVAEAHLRDCALMPACQKSGYGVFTNDNKFLKFDEAGSRKALEAIKASKKLDDLEVEVTGELQGDTIKVASLKLL